MLQYFTIIIFHQNKLNRQKKPSEYKIHFQFFAFNHTFFYNHFSDVSSNNNSPSSRKYNIFKTAFNRGTELLKCTFLSKGTNTSDCIDLRTPTRASVSTTLSSSKPSESEIYNETPSSASESTTPSDCSSPDSIKTELMFFKPISREPRTFSNASTKIMRIPSIRSTSSTSVIQSPCPSPFFIPITHQRQSAFSFVSPCTIELEQKLKPKNTKRKNIKPSPEKKFDNSLPKRQKVAAAKKGNRVLQTENKKKKTESSRETRSMKKNNEDLKMIVSVRKQTITRRQQQQQQQQLQEFKKPISTRDSKRQQNENLENDFRRVTRSMKT